MANNKVSPITLQSNDVAILGSQGNSIITHNNGLTSIRAAGTNDLSSVDPFNDDCSGIYASPGGISLNTKSAQTNYQTIGSTQTQQNDPKNIVQANVPVPSVSVTLPVQAPIPSISPTPSPTPTPPPDEEEKFVDLILLPFREDSPVKEFIIDDIIVMTNVIPDDLLVEENKKIVSYSGTKQSESTKASKTSSESAPKVPYTISNNKLIVDKGVLVGNDGDVDQKIILPNPIPGQSGNLTDGYRGKLPVIQPTHSNKLISFTEFIATCKKINLTEQQARNIISLIALEAGKNKEYFTGWNNNFGGLQAEGRWRDKVSQYIDYRYIARDRYGLRIFAGFTSIDRALAAKAEGMRFKGLLDATDANSWGYLYRRKWVASGWTDPSLVKDAANVYISWGKTKFNEYNKSY